MKPGKEFDALIAKKVMGCYEKKNRKGCYDLIVPGDFNRIDYVQKGACWSGCPGYSTDHTAAWQVVEKMKSDLYNYAVGIRGYYYEYEEYMESYQVRFEKYTANGKGRFEWGDTLPEAICLAALKAVGVEV